MQEILGKAVGGPREKLARKRAKSRQNLGRQTGNPGQTKHSVPEGCSGTDAGSSPGIQAAIFKSERQTDARRIRLIDGRRRQTGRARPGEGSLVPQRKLENRMQISSAAARRYSGEHD